MKFLKKTKTINLKSKSQIKTIAVSSFLVVILGVVLVLHLKTSYASGYTYTYLGKTVWNPKLTQFYQNSDFYSYACQNPGSNSNTADVVVAMVASSYVSFMQSGSYEPSATAEINGSKIVDLGVGWSFNGVFATGTSVNNPGAWLRSTDALVNLPLTDTLSMGPLATSYWPTVQTAPVKIASLSECQSSTASTAQSTPTTPTPTPTTTVSSTSTPTKTTPTTTSTSSTTPIVTTSTKSNISVKTTTSTTTPTSSTSSATNTTHSSTSSSSTTSSSQKNQTVTPVTASSLTTQLVSGLQTPSGISFLDPSLWFWSSQSSGELNSLDATLSPISGGLPNGYMFGLRFSFTQASSSFNGFVGLETKSQSKPGEAAIFSITGSNSSSGSGSNSSGTVSGLTYNSSEVSYNWQNQQSYKLEIKLTGQTATTYTWTATVNNYPLLGAATTIGSIITPINLGLIYGQTETFVDRYSGVDTSCSNITSTEVEFSNVSSDNGSISPVTHFSPAPTETGCNGNYETEDMPGQVIQIVW